MLAFCILFQSFGTGTRYSISCYILKLVSPFLIYGCSSPLLKLRVDLLAKVHQVYSFAVNNHSTSRFAYYVNNEMLYTHTRPVSQSILSKGCVYLLISRLFLHLLIFSHTNVILRRRGHDSDSSELTAYILLLLSQSGQR